MLSVNSASGLPRFGNPTFSSSIIRRGQRFFVPIFWVTKMRITDVKDKTQEDMKFVGCRQGTEIHVFWSNSLSGVIIFTISTIPSKHKYV